MAGGQTPRKRTPDRSGEPDSGTSNEPSTGDGTPATKRPAKAPGQGALGEVATRRVAAAAAAAAAISNSGPDSSATAKAEIPTAEQTLAATASDHAAGSKLSGEAAVEKDAVAAAASAAAAAAVAAVNAAIAATAATKATRADKARMDAPAAVKGTTPAPAAMPATPPVPAPPVSAPTPVARTFAVEPPPPPASDDPTVRYARPLPNVPGITRRETIEAASSAAATPLAPAPITPAPVAPAPATNASIPNVPGITRRETLEGTAAGASAAAASSSPAPIVRPAPAPISAALPNIPGITRRESLETPAPVTTPPAATPPPAFTTAGAAAAAAVIAAASGAPVPPTKPLVAPNAHPAGLPAVPGIIRREQIDSTASPAPQPVAAAAATPTATPTSPVKPPPLFSNEGVVRQHEGKAGRGRKFGPIGGLIAALLGAATALGHSVGDRLPGGGHGKPSPDFDRNGKPRQRVPKFWVAIGGIAAVLILAFAVVPIVAPPAQPRHNAPGSPGATDVVANAGSHDPNVVPGTTDDPSVDPSGVIVDDESLAPGATRKPTKSPTTKPSTSPGSTQTPTPTPTPTPAGPTPTIPIIPTVPPTIAPTPTPTPTPVPTPLPTRPMIDTVETGPLAAGANYTFWVQWIPNAPTKDCFITRTYVVGATPQPVPTASTPRNSSRFAIWDDGWSGPIPWGGTAQAGTYRVTATCNLPGSATQTTSLPITIIWQ